MKISAYIEDYDIAIPEHTIFACNKDSLPNVRKDRISGNFGYFDFYKIHFDDLCICNCCSDIHDDLCLNVKTSGESIVLIFINRGRARLENCLLKPCKFCQNSFNLYYLTGEIDFVLDLKRGNENKYFGLAISKRFYTNLGNKHSALFEPINRKISLKSSFSLFNKGIFISYEIDQIIRQIQDCELKGKATSLFMEAKIQELFAILLSARNNQQVGEISQYVRDKLYEARFIIERKYRRPLRIHDLAIQVGTNDTTLKAGFKKLFNRTVFGYLSDYRMNKAKKLLRTEKSLSISDIALKIGYESHSNFTTAFKRKIGITPKKFRQ